MGLASDFFEIELATFGDGLFGVLLYGDAAAFLGSLFGEGGE